VVYPLNEAVDAIIDTWGKRCDKLLFTSIEDVPEKNVVKIPNIVQGKDLWKIVHSAFTYVWEEIIVRNNEHYDWIFKLDDDSFVIIENFKHLVREKNYTSDQPYYLGLTTPNHGVNHQFNTGSGYVISKKSLEIVAPHLPSSKSYSGDDPKACTTNKGWAEDLMMSECLKPLGILPNDSKDDMQRESFLVFHPADHLQMVRRKDSTSWFWNNKPKTVRHGGNCCSTRPITWHGYKVESRSHRAYYYMDYLMYELEVRNS
jgi:glycoprotein-N-acetylgalactosamine 3-beta-galactosyltransferase